MPGLSPEFRVIFSEEFRTQILNKGFMFFTTIILVGMLAAIPLTPVIVDLFERDLENAVAETPEESRNRVGYFDLTGQISPVEYENSPVVFSSKDEGISAVRNGDLDSFFVFPPEYLQTGNVEQYWMNSGQNRFELLWGVNQGDRDTISSYLRISLLGGQVDESIIERVVHPGSFQALEVVREGEDLSATSVAAGIGGIIVPMLFGVLLMVAAVTGSGTLLRSVAEEKETRMIELLVTSASPFSILTGKLFAVISAGMIHMAIWVLVGFIAIPEIFDRVPGGGDLNISAQLWMTIAVSFVFGYFLYSVLAMFIGSVMSSAAEGQRQTGMLSLMAGMPLWVSGLVLNVPDSIIAKILTWFPFTAPTMLMVRHGGGSTISAGETSLVLGLVAVTGIVMLWIAARVFRAGILLSGQRITGRNVLNAIRHAE